MPPASSIPPARPPIAGPRLLHDTGRIALLMQPGPVEMPGKMPGEMAGGAAIVTFAPRQEARAIWGGDFLARFGACRFGLIDYSASWYPEEDMASLLPVLAPILAGYDRVVLYGFSMGAYAALKYSARLGADAVLAFSPQYSIAPADVEDFDQRRSSLYFQPALHRDMRIQPRDLGGTAVLFHDPGFLVDSQHAALIRAQGPVRAVATPLAEHASLRFMISAGQVEPLLRKALSGAPLRAAALRRDFRAQRLLSADYVLLLAGLLEKRWGQPAATRLLDAALRAGNRAAGPRLALAHHRLDEGDSAAAAALLLPLAAAQNQPLAQPRDRPPTQPRDQSPPPPDNQPVVAQPEDQAMLAEAQRRLRLHAGTDSPEPERFPAGDPLWTGPAAFLAGHAMAEDRILAPAAFRDALPAFDSYAGRDPARDYDWVLLHKDSMALLGSGLLAALGRDSTPVYANAQFILWARHPSFGLLDLRDEPEVAAVIRDLTGQWLAAEH